MKRLILFLLSLSLYACAVPGAPVLETKTVGAKSEVIFTKSATADSAISEVKVSTVDGVKVYFDSIEADKIQLSTTEYVLLTGLTIRIVDNQTIELKFDPDLWEVTP